MDGTDSAGLLRRIAAGLGMPIEAFFMVDSGSTNEEDRALLAAFGSLRNARARRRVLAATDAEVRKERRWDG